MENPLREHWQTLIELLDEAFRSLGAKRMDSASQKLMQLSKKAASLGLADLGVAAARLYEFLENFVKLKKDEEAAATLSFAMGALVEKMQIQQYGPEFSSSLPDVLVYLDFYGEEESPSESEAAPEVVLPTSHSLTKGIEEVPTESSPSSRPPTEAPMLDVLPSTGGALDDSVEQIEANRASGRLDEPPSPGEMAKGPGPFPEEPEDISSPYRFLEKENPPELQTIAEADEIHGDSTSLPTDKSPLSMDVVDRYRLLLELDPVSRVFVSFAEELFDRRLWKEVVETCRKGLSLHPYDLRAQTLLGLALWELDEREQAERVLQQARKELERNAKLYYALAAMAESRGDFEDAQFFHSLYEDLQNGRVHVEPPVSQSIVAEPEVGDGVGQQVELGVAAQQRSPLELLSALMSAFAEKPKIEERSPQNLLTEEDRETLSTMLRHTIA